MADIQALVIHNDEEGRFVQPGKVFLSDVLLFGAHEDLKIKCL
jgi:hypothetical protein